RYPPPTPRTDSVKKTLGPFDGDRIVARYIARGRCREVKYAINTFNRLLDNFWFRNIGAHMLYCLVSSPSHDRPTPQDAYTFSAGDQRLDESSSYESCSAGNKRCYHHC